ncbi:MAG: hypothetical protein C4583_13865 [Anaerolineaceae bacterium]|nr:MAG: hypothetical protein C4583_13865 [Anaerolineaceae bacterium]
MKFVQYVALIVGTGSLVRGYFAEGRTASAYWILGLGAFWLLGEIRRWRWTATLGFLSFVAAAGYGLWSGLSPLWMLAGAVGALVTWDLSDFRHRVQEAAPEDEIAGLARRHLLRLAIVTGLGLAFSLFGMFFRLQFSFEWTAFLAILSALGVAYLIGRIRRGER